MLAAHKCLVHTKINKACKSQRDLLCALEEIGGPSRNSKFVFFNSGKHPPPNNGDSRYLHTEAADGNDIAGIPSLYQEGQGLQDSRYLNTEVAADISTLRSSLPMILNRPLHYIYKEASPKPNAAEKQGGIPPPTTTTTTTTTAPLRFVANGMALPSCPKTDGAALMLAVAQKKNGNLTAAEAMKQVAFPAEDCNNKSIQRRVLRQKNKMLAEAIPSTVELNQDTTSISPLTSTPVDIIADWDIISALAAEQQQRDREDCTDKATTADSTAVPASSASRANSTSCAGSKRGSVAVARIPAFINKEKPRRNATQLNYMHAARQEQKERYLKGVAAGIKMYRDHQSGECTVHKSDEDIANCVSRLHGTSITVGTIRYRVWKQNTHQHDLVEPCAGRPSKPPPMVEKALVTAMETYSNLMSAEMKEKPNCPGQIERLESCLKDSPSTLKDSVALYKRLSAKYAVEVEISTKNLQLEERRCVWTTSNNINTWFETVKEILVVYGFARLVTEEEIRNGHEGELVFFPGQLNCILNVDETALTLDGTSTNAGGRSITEYGPSNRILPRGCTRAQKSSWTCTVVAGSTAAGDPIPFHFQWKSSATEENKRISKSFTDELDKSGTCSGVWSIPGATVESPTQMPHTVNFNQAAGMDSVEFRKYFETSILALFSDAQPAKGKYVCFIVDSGPGRSDPELHRLMSTEGFLLIAGVPNTTHVTQVTDVSFDPFKTAFRYNKKKLHAYWQSKKQTVKTVDIPALVFGYKESRTLQLRSAFEEAFAPAVNRACWAKKGIALFTRKCLGDRNVAYELMTLANGMINVDADPKTVALLELERRNRIAVQTLVDHRFNGGVYAKNAPRISLKSTLPKTQPNTRAYQDELQQSTAAGPRYTVLRGRAYNCKDQHIVYERIWREGDINAMKETKTKALAYTKNKEAAEAIMEQCYGDFMDLPVLQLRKVFEWKLQEKSAKLNNVTQTRSGVLSESHAYLGRGKKKVTKKQKPPLFTARLRKKTGVVVSPGLRDHILNDASCYSYFKQSLGLVDFASCIFIRKSKKLEDATQQLGLTNTRNGPQSSDGALPEVLDNQVMYDPSVEPIGRALIGQELTNIEDDNDSVSNDNFFFPNDDDEEEGSESIEAPHSLSVNDDEEDNNIDVDDSHCDSNTTITTPNVGRNISDELKVKIKLMKIMRNHSIPLVAEKELYEWAIESERLNLFSWTKGNLIKTRASVMKEISATVPEIKGDGFEPHLIDWCSKKSQSADVSSRKQIYVRSFQKALHSLLTNVTLVNEDNLSFPHAEDPTLPVRYPELQGNIDIDELHHGEWWINTWEKRCKSKSNEILVPIILYMDGIAIDNSGQTTLTPLNMTLGIFNTLTRNSRPDAWEAIYFHPTGSRDKGAESIDNVNNLHSGLRLALSSLKDACNQTDGIEWSNLPWNKKKWSVRMKFAVAYFIGDTPQHDQLCGHYQTSNSKMICRHCNCPRALGINARVNVLKVPVSLKSGNMQVSKHQNGDEYKSIRLWNISDFTAPTVDKGVNVN
eukprot:jgi/Psemu1/45378/gm1.45378_g